MTLPSAKEEQIKTWLKNIMSLHFREKSLCDLPSKIGNQPILIAGAGSSLERWIDAGGLVTIEDDVRHPINFFIIANQSSLLRLVDVGIHPDICVVTDSHECIPGRIGQARKWGWEGSVVAATSCSQSLFADTQPVYWFKHPFYEPYGEHKNVYNMVLDLTSPSVKDWIVQVGCVGNASILVANALLKLKKLSSNSIYLVGIDYCYEPHPRCKQYNEEAGDFVWTSLAAEQGPFFDERGYITSQVMLEYKKDLKIIVEKLHGDIKLLYPGFCDDIIGVLNDEDID